MKQISPNGVAEQHIREIHRKTRAQADCRGWNRELGRSPGPSIRSSLKTSETELPGASGGRSPTRKPSLSRKHGVSAAAHEWVAD